MKPRAFNLQMREPNRDPTNANAGFKRYSRKRWADQQANAERAKALQELSAIGFDLPICPVCHGRSLDWSGHPRCTGRWA